jgi:hypothetical protein
LLLLPLLFPLLLPLPLPLPLPLLLLLFFSPGRIVKSAASTLLANERCAWGPRPRQVRQVQRVAGPRRSRGDRTLRDGIMRAWT